MKNNDKYIKRFSTLSNAGCGVVFTRTAEPFRAEEALREYARGHDLPFSVWNSVEGWCTQLPSDEPDAVPTYDKADSAFGALKWIADVDGAGQGAKEAGIFIMHATHPWLNKLPPMVQCLRHYVRDFAELTRVRLILVMPENEKLPPELVHDIPIVDFDLPNQEEVGEILDYIIESSTPEEEEAPEMFTPVERETIIASAGGLTEMEGQLAFSEAIVTHRPKDGPWHNISFSNFNSSVLKSKTEVVKQSDILELMPPVSMADVGGLDVLKEWITEAGVMFTQEARDFGADMPRGIAAIGPPGTGKTLLAKAVADALNTPLVKFDIASVFNKYQGESESRVRSALKMVEAMGRVTVVFDEIDKGLGGAHKSGGDSGTAGRVLGTILTFLSETRQPLFPIFTANRVQGLDSALLRKGRLDEVFAVLPPNKVEREIIFRIHLAKRKQKVKNLSKAVDASRGYVGAEIEAAVNESVKEAFFTKKKITDTMLARKITGMCPLYEAFPEDFDAMMQWASTSAKPSSTFIENEEGVNLGARLEGKGKASRKRKKRRAVDGGGGLN